MKTFDWAKLNPYTPPGPKRPFKHKINGQMLFIDQYERVFLYMPMQKQFFYKFTLSTENGTKNINE